MEMVGREVIFRVEKTEVEKGKTITRGRKPFCDQRQRSPGLKGVSFSISEGEIFGIAGNCRQRAE